GKSHSFAGKETAMAKKRVENAPAPAAAHAGVAHAGAAHAGAAHAGAARPVAELRRRVTARFGWGRGPPDPRDQLSSVSLETLRALPKSVDLRSKCPPVYDQGRIGSCTANAIAAAIQFDRLKNQQSPDFVPSRLFIYYNERYMEHDVSSDAGA